MQGTSTNTIRCHGTISDADDSDFRLKDSVEICVFSGSSSTQTKTRATLSEDGQNYILNGRKAWVVNGSMADIYTVFALTSIPNTQVSLVP